MDEETPRAALPPLMRPSFRIERRRFMLACLCGVALNFLKPPASLASRKAHEDEFIIVDGWILKASDLRD